MDKKFGYAGVSRFKGEFKARWASDAARVKVLAKGGHTDIDIVQLPNPMTKLEAVQYLLSINFDNGNATVRAALEEAVEKRLPKGASLSAIRARKTETVEA